MIITQLIGGLGNQMFQYSVGRALAYRMGSDFKVDISGFKNYKSHYGFELQRIFNSNCLLANVSDIRSVLRWQSPSFIRRVLLKSCMRGFRCKQLVVEPHFKYWQGINELKVQSYLTGNWQSEKYFAEVAREIRNDFTFKIPMRDKNIELANQISKVNAVSLHVRRGDYANNQKYLSIHGLCSIEYYLAAIKYFSEHLKRPYFFVFSDDIKWVKSNLKINHPCIYVDHNNGTESYNDMHLMSMCKHHIIANSSFSWWGAWLNPSSDKIVISPKQWFAKKTDTKDLIPPEWIRL